MYYIHRLTRVIEEETVMRRLLGAVVIAAASLIPVSNAASAPPGSDCSWGAKSDPDSVNVAFPDTNATYWSYQYRAVPGTRLVIHGSYPKARYFSFHVYQPNAVPIDSIYDVQVRPDARSQNPFTGPAKAKSGRGYTVKVEFTAKPAHPATNTIYAGRTEIQGAPNPAGVLMLRVYVPVNPRSPQGGVPLPAVTWQTTDGKVLSAGTACSRDLPSVGGAVNGLLTENSVPVQSPQDGSASPIPAWNRAFGTPYAGAFGNEQNAYLTARINRAYGSLVVIHAKAPTFPDTSRGGLVYRPHQLRYWSMCENSNDTRVVLCAADYKTGVKNGYYTYVVSDPSQRPRNATARYGVTWLPWGAADAAGLLIYRNMVPATSFRHAAQNISKNDDPKKVMGAYYPTAVYCDKTTFEHGGWASCYYRQ
jgi:hypothetical protein